VKNLAGTVIDYFPEALIHVELTERVSFEPGDQVHRRGDNKSYGIVIAVNDSTPSVTVLWSERGRPDLEASAVTQVQQEIDADIIRDLTNASRRQ